MEDSEDELYIEDIEEINDDRKKRQRYNFIK